MPPVFDVFRSQDGFGHDLRFQVIEPDNPHELVENYTPVISQADARLNSTATTSAPRTAGNKANAKAARPGTDYDPRTCRH